MRLILDLARADQDAGELRRQYLVTDPIDLVYRRQSDGDGRGEGPEIIDGQLEAGSVGPSVMTASFARWDAPAVIVPRCKQRPRARSAVHAGDSARGR